MYNQNNINALMESFIHANSQLLNAFSENRHKLSESIHSMAQNHLDSTIDGLKQFHAFVSGNDSDMRSDYLAATIKRAIDHHQHMKDGMRLHKEGANLRQNTLRRLAMGLMATFGVMSSAKAADAAGLEESSDSKSSSVVVSDSSDTHYYPKLNMRSSDIMRKFAIGDKADNYRIFAEHYSKLPGHKQDAVDNYKQFASLYYPQPGDSKAVINERIKQISQSDLLDAAEQIAKFGQEYYRDAAKLFKMVYSHEAPNLAKADFKRAADTLVDFGEAYYPDAVELYMMFAKYKNTEAALKIKDGAIAFLKEINASSDEIKSMEGKYYDGKIDLIDLSREVSGLGKAFYPQAAEILMMLADKTDTVSLELIHAAEALKELGPEYQQQVEYLLLKYGEHQDTPVGYILDAAKELANLGNNKYAFELFKKVVDHTESDPSDIQEALAEISKIAKSNTEDWKFDLIDLSSQVASLGNAFYPQAAEFLMILADKSDTTYLELSAASDALREFGAEYKQQLGKVLAKLGEHKKATTFYKLDAAKELVNLGSTNKAIKLFKQVVDNKNSTPSDIQEALAEIAKLTPSKGKAKSKK